MKGISRSFLYTPLLHILVRSSPSRSIWSQSLSLSNPIKAPWPRYRSFHCLRYCSSIESQRTLEISSSQPRDSSLYRQDIPRYQYRCLQSKAERSSMDITQPISSGTQTAEISKISTSHSTEASSLEVETNGYTIGYATDCEGNYDYWQRYIRMSKVLHQEEPCDGKGAATVRLRPMCHFVYGGDVCDRGSGDMRLLRDLMLLKRSSPNHVHFILGNRDVNKLRLLFELHHDVLGDSSDYSDPSAPIYWVRGGTTKPDGAPLKQATLTRSYDSTSSMQTERLKWILNDTMGAPLAFEYRRRELQILAKSESSHDSVITDAAVTQSFLDLIDPKFIVPDGETRDEHDYRGLLIEFLQVAQVMLQLNDVLFVHGAILPYNIGWLPPFHYDQPELFQEFEDRLKDPYFLNQNISSLGYYEKDFVKWMNAINLFVRSEVEDYINNATNYIASYKQSSSEEKATDSLYWAATGGYQHKQPGSRLLQYGMGWLADKSVNPSVIYATYSSRGQVIYANGDVASTLKKYQIKTIIVGHQPNGDTPLIIGHDSDPESIQVICGDTSYSKNVLWHNNQRDSILSQRNIVEDYNNRRISYAELIVSPNDQWRALTDEEILDIIARRNSKSHPDGDSEMSSDDITIPPTDSTRGLTVSEIFIEARQNIDQTKTESERSIVCIEGTLSNGMRYHCNLSHELVKPYLGRQIPEGWMVKSIHSTSANMSEMWALLSKGEGYDCKNIIIPYQELQTILSF